MMLASLDIPDNPAQWPEWLEQQIVGPQLGHLVAELQMLQASPENAPESLEAICGERLPAVLQAGFSALSEAQIRSLLKQPETLLDLQERIFISGGSFWDRVSQDDNLRAQAAAVWESVAPRLTRVGETAAPRVMPASQSRPRGRRIGTWLLSTVAAVLLAGLGLWWSRPAATGWGWDRPGALTASLPADRYLQHLADGAEEWFKRRPEDRAALTKRLAEFRHGCQTLIEAPHPQLAPADRTWLVEKCQAWAGKLDQHLADLQSGQDLPKVQADADATVRKLIGALRTKAGELQG